MSTVRPVIRVFGGVEVTGNPVEPDLGIGDMLLYYDFDDTAPTVEDKSGNDNGDQTLFGSISLSDSVLGDAAALVNISGSASSTLPAALDFENESFSVSFWIRLDSAPADADTLLAASASFSLFDLGYVVRYRTAGGGILQTEIDRTGGGIAWHDHSWAPSTSTWYHIVCVCEDDGSSGSTLTSYINNSASTGTAAIRPQATTGGSPQLNLLNWKNLNKTDGAMAKVRIFGKALSAAQVQTLYDEHSSDA